MGFYCLKKMGPNLRHHIRLGDVPAGLRLGWRSATWNCGEVPTQVQSMNCRTNEIASIHTALHTTKAFRCQVRLNPEGLCSTCTGNMELAPNP